MTLARTEYPTQRNHLRSKTRKLKLSKDGGKRKTRNNLSSKTSETKSSHFGGGRERRTGDHDLGG